MSDEKKAQETKSDEQKTEQKTDQKPLEITIDPETAFQLKLQEFDKAIAIAEAQAADLKKQKIEFIYNRNVQLITEAYKKNQMQKQVEEEMKSKLANADIGK